VSIKDVVAQDQRAPPALYEVLRHDEGVRQSQWRALNRIADPDTPLASVAKLRSESFGVARVRDDEDVPDAREHQHAERIVDQRLVVDWHQLLGDRKGEGIEPAPPSTGEDDSAALAHDCFFPVPASLALRADQATRRFRVS